MSCWVHFSALLQEQHENSAECAGFYDDRASLHELSYQNVEVTWLIRHCYCKNFHCSSDCKNSNALKQAKIFRNKYPKTPYELLDEHSHWLRAGRLRGRGSIPGRVKNVHFSMSSRPVLGSTQPPIQWVPGYLCGG
jgi:hypothetical protein